jgi:hypothetical protein
MGTHGFALETSPSPTVEKRLDELIRDNSAPSDVLAPVNAAYMEEMVPLIMRISGAREVIAQYDTITVRFSSRSIHRSWMTTAAFAHMDFEPSEVRRILSETLALTNRQVRPSRRQVLYQTWRVLTAPPQDRPLGVCDMRTAQAQDVVPLQFHGPEGSRNELVRSRACRFSARHEWYYFPDMVPSEVILFRGFDSDDPASLNVVHTSFDDDSNAEFVPRGSIECRFLALYD